MQWNIEQEPETEEFSFSLLPKGGYRVLIAEAQFKYRTGDVNTNWINVRFDILPYDGHGDYEYMGRRIYNNFTWQNQNADAVRIGRQQLADLIFAANPNLKVVNNPKEVIDGILDKEIFVEIYHSKRKDNQELEARIGGYWSVSGRQRKANPKPLPPPPGAAYPTHSSQPKPTARAAGPSKPAPTGLQGHPAFEDAPF